MTYLFCMLLLKSSNFPYIILYFVTFGKKHVTDFSAEWEKVYMLFLKTFELSSIFTELKTSTDVISNQI